MIEKRETIKNLLVEKITKIVEEECKKETNFFGYGIWEYHITSIVKYAKILAKEFECDEEIVKIAALLHDYASIKDYNMYEEHHIHGAKEAEKILKGFKYPQNKIEMVKECIFAHRGSKVMTKTSKEAICIADADAMSHFDYIGSMFYLAFFSHKMDVKEANVWLKGKLNRSWNKLSDKGKELIKPKYDAIMLLLEN